MLANGKASLQPINSPNELLASQKLHNCWTYVYGHPDLYRWFLSLALDPKNWADLKPIPFAAAQVSET
jgi:hypothetical protein